ncbi:APC family permease [Arcicella rigui]|uniref:Amino acid permease n=1 Tax=Arcicella rigui TaxID=797020 RepID=A0ABU5QAF4_9BACT|nr:amino acid permease [Arcicella rigui]MEA5139557.1 amino acid permease [Arcicella rigui]
MINNSIFRRKSIQNVLKQNDDSHGGGGLVKILGVRDLTAFGVAAIIGAGIFSTIGRASFEGGPAVSLLFVFVSIACIFTALCYAQFASMVPVSGSAYTYAYVSFGEIFAWIIGWALILEYAVSNMVVAISWSEYFVGMLAGFGINFPDYLTIDYGTAHRAFLASQNASATLTDADLFAAKAYEHAPILGSFKFLIDLPAGVITILVTSLVYVGMKESRTASNFLVVLKLLVILLVISVGAFYIKPENWSPFAPNGAQGVLGGVASVFFAFIGFDSISTTAEECKNPQRDLPRAMIYCLVICAVLYVCITLVLTGMVNYTELKVDDPLAYVFQKIGFNFMAGVISVSAVVAITSALLVYQMGQPRIWMAMSRDGLLWKRFSEIHPKFKTPSFATIITGLVVAIPSLFLDMGFFVDLTSVGTFFAFILVCGGVLYLDYQGLSKDAKFKIPYLNGQYLVGILFVITISFVFYENKLFSEIHEKPLLVVFWLTWLVLSVLAYMHKFSMLPVLGVLTNLYLMTELGITNWTIFIIWLAIGLVIYFMYGYKHSKLSK